MRKTKVLIVLLGISLLMACSSAPTNSNSKNNAPTNSNVANANSTPKDAVIGTEQDEQIKPDANAKLENGKKMPPVLDMDISLPADWKLLKKANSVDFFVPAKITEDGIAGVYIRTYSYKENESPVNDKRAMFESMLKVIKKEKESGQIQYLRTLPILSDSQGAIMGILNLRENAAPDAKPNKKCDVDNVPNCGLYGWSGYYGGKFHDSYFVGIVFPPGTYEKNKLTIDSIIKSVRLR